MGHPEFLRTSAGLGGERSGCGKWGLLGCLSGVVILAGVLVVSFQSMQSSVWDTARRARERVERRLPLELPAAQRQRTLDNLEGFFDVLEQAEEPYPIMGGFMRRANQAFADSYLSPSEVADLNEYLESVIADRSADATTGRP
jgi:hypothetical protein